MHCPPLRPLPSPQHLTGIGLALCHSEGSSSSNPKHIARMICHLVWRRQLPAAEIERHHLQAPCIPRVVRLVQGADMIPAHPKQTEHAHGKSVCPVQSGSQMAAHTGFLFTLPTQNKAAPCNQTRTTSTDHTRIHTCGAQRPRPLLLQERNHSANEHVQVVS